MTLTSCGNDGGSPTQRETLEMRNLEEKGVERKENLVHDILIFNLDIFKITSLF